MSERGSSAGSDGERKVPGVAGSHDCAWQSGEQPRDSVAGLENSANTRYWRVGRAGGRCGYTRLTRTSRGTPSLHVGVEPRQGALDYVAAVLGAGEQVTLMLVDYELGFNA